MRTKWLERWVTPDITQRGSVVIAEAALYQLYPSSETKVDRSSGNRVRRCRQIGGATSLPAGLEARLVSWWDTLLIRSKLYSRSYFCKVFHFPFIFVVL